MSVDLAMKVLGWYAFGALSIPLFEYSHEAECGIGMGNGKLFLACLLAVGGPLILFAAILNAVIVYANSED
jgi:hypothetical protein